jgi:hypothetical protein
MRMPTGAGMATACSISMPVSSCGKSSVRFRMDRCLQSRPTTRRHQRPHTLAEIEQPIWKRRLGRLGAFQAGIDLRWANAVLRNVGSDRSSLSASRTRSRQLRSCRRQQPTLIGLFLVKVYDASLGISSWTNRKNRWLRVPATTDSRRAGTHGPVPPPETRCTRRRPAPAPRGQSTALQCWLKPERLVAAGSLHVVRGAPRRRPEAYGHDDPPRREGPQAGCRRLGRPAHRRPVCRRATRAGWRRGGGPCTFAGGRPPEVTRGGSPPT